MQHVARKALRSSCLVAALTFLMTACGQPSPSSPKTEEATIEDGSPAASATPDCEGTVGKYGCYDLEWCITNWGGMLREVAVQASGGDALIDWIAGAVDFVQDELPAREAEMGLRSIQSVVVAAQTDGAAAGALEALDRARADCGDPGFFEAELAFQLRFVG